ncbi:MAG: hypothetical protein JXA69_14480 [Phycisphaerae bacterium]|nr:hypothetical protein [Phycisphaerae bacterium]
MRSVILTHVNIGEGYPNKPMTRVIRARQAQTTFKRGSTVGAGSIVLHGVTIGEDAAVGAGVVVKKDVPPRTVVRSSAHEPPYTVAERFLRAGP